MKKAMLALAATSVIALSACGSSDKVVTSKAGDITQEEFYNAMKENQAGQQMLKNMVMEKVFINNYKVDDKEVDKKFEDTKKQIGDQFDMLLEQQGLTEKSFKNSIRAQLAMEKAVSKSITEKDLKALNKPEIKASHILVKDEETAKNIKAELDQGKSFEELAKEKSEDPGSAENGGDLGYFGPGKMVPEFEEAAYGLKKDEISEPVKTQHGYHIIKVTDIKEAKPYEEVKDELKEQAIAAKYQDAKFMEDLIAKELKKADVDVKDKDLKELFETPKEGEKTKEEK
ncbi:peptidylprolyl isomerase [Bacillus manliponensis]|uniref:Foldase protein PrsA n=1 Tax=Bacillus manliponensis TaxID=574376 RepID=A0A073KCT4_9BACI|nr:peptidylprolyl isomerase PrsA [Bacillus manliponensis]KEK20118.1 peptidylprolyl isomerase [Bacillus manliponensis]